ncbi:MAG: hypothetical protein JXQ83_02150 [Candidatus Glassbacteria bacterium]|nr:hypothetical protein [Candidatus Glassbacteria bacterium]
MSAVKLKISNILIAAGVMLLLVRSNPLPAQVGQDTAAAPEGADTLAAEQAGQVDEFDASVGYNLKVIVRLAPVYQEPSLVSPIVAHLPKNSVVAVSKEEDRWYRIAFGPEGSRTIGWVISYGMERTHELEFIVTSREDAARYEGEKIVVVSGEAAVRSFPSPQAGVLMNVYRDEVFDVAGESADYFRIALSKAVQGWIWKGDVDDYVEPKFSREEVKEMSQTSHQQIARLKDLDDLLAELEQRGELLNGDIEKLEQLAAEKRAADEAAARKTEEPSFFEYERLKKRTHLSFGIQRQGFTDKLGLSAAMLKGLGIGFDWNDRFKFDFSYYSGSPAVRALGPEQDPLPSSMDNLDTLAVSSSLMRFGLRFPVPAPKMPLLKGMDHFLYAGLGKMSLKPSAGGIQRTQSLWGAALAWGMNKRLFGHLQLDLSLNFFLTRADVTEVLNSGRPLLLSEKAFLMNSGFSMGVIWDF